MPGVIPGMLSISEEEERPGTGESRLLRSRGSAMPSSRPSSGGDCSDEIEFADGVPAHLARRRGSILDWSDPKADVEMDDLERELEQIKKKNKFMRAETAMYEAYLMKQQQKEAELSGEADKLNPAHSDDGRSSVAPEEGGTKSRSSMSVGAGSRNARRRSKRSHASLRTTKRSQEPATLTAGMKLQVVTDKLTHTEHTIRAEVKQLLGRRDGTQAQVDEAREQSKFIDDNAKLFQRWAVSQVNFQGKHSWERCVRYITERIKDDAAKMDHMKLQIAITRGAIHKIQEDLEKEEKQLEGSVSQVDYDQLTITNMQYMQALEQGNSLLLTAKTQVMESAAQQNKLAEKLRLAQLESDELDDTIERTNRLDERLGRDHDKAMIECQKSGAINKKLRNQITGYKAPTVLEFVEYVALVQKAKVQLGMWLRKVEVAEDVMKRTRKHWNYISKRVLSLTNGYSTRERQPEAMTY